MDKANRVINRRKYELAQDKIRRGAWIADPEAGTLYSVKFKRLVAPAPNSLGYHTTDVWDPQTKRSLTVRISRVLWEYVHGVIPDGYDVNHKNGNKSDNGSRNLELLTMADNIRHAHETGLWPSIIRSPLASQIVEALETGEPQRSIAKRFGIGMGTVSRVNQRRPGYEPPRCYLKGDHE
jgi:hypothetical protein